MNVASLSSPPSENPSVRSSLLVRIAKLRYLTVSMLFHVVLVLVCGSAVLIKHIMEPPDFMAEPGGLFTNETVTHPPQTEPVLLQPQPFAASAPSAASAPAPSALFAIATSAPTQSTFSVATAVQPSLAVKVNTQANSPPAPMSSGVLSKESAARIASFTGGWAKGGTASYSRPLKSREFEFTAYLAKYSGGDWDSTVRMEGDEIAGGSLPNLLFVIGTLSHKKIHAEPQAVPLDLASEEIFTKKPPFIWFTGHRDFKLTEEEAINLAEYLRHGGCLWGDSSLPGQRSRFDIAFRREMLRVVPPGQQWQALPPNHPIYTNAYYPEIHEAPPGINFYHEPIYALTGYGGEIAILYTANDYGDMWQFGIDEKGEIDLRRDEKHRMVAVNEEMWHRRNLYFRNIEPKALFDTYKFGTNIVVHLLTRWENKIRNVPRGMNQ